MRVRALRRLLPSRESLEKVRHLRFLGPFLARPWLWHFNRRTVAVGLAVGVFIGFMLPMGLQAPVAAIGVLWARGNLAVAMLSTLVTNPFTVVPVYYVAYRLGAFLTGAEFSDASASAAASTLGKIASVGAPLATGLFVMGLSAALVCYVGTSLLWRLFTTIAWRRRLRMRNAKRAAA